MNYSQGIAKFYDLFDPPDLDRDESARFLTSLVTSGSRVLEIGAGIGTTAFALAERGVRVTALEPDAEMYSMLLSRLALRPDLHGLVSPIPRGAGYSLHEKFDVCACFAVLHLVPPEARAALVAYAASQLRPGGQVVLEMPVASTGRTPKPWDIAAVRDLGGVRFEHHSAVEAAGDGKWRTHWKFRVLHEENVLEEVLRTFQWHALDIGESDRLLASQGLVVDEEFGGADRSPFVRNESRVRLVVAHAI